MNEHSFPECPLLVFFGLRKMGLYLGKIFLNIQKNSIKLYGKFSDIYWMTSNNVSAKITNVRGDEIINIDKNQFQHCIC